MCIVGKGEKVIYKERKREGEGGGGKRGEGGGGGRGGGAGQADGDRGTEHDQSPDMCFEVYRGQGLEMARHACRLHPKPVAGEAAGPQPTAQLRPLVEVGTKAGAVGGVGTGLGQLIVHEGVSLVVVLVLYELHPLDGTALPEHSPNLVLGDPEVHIANVHLRKGEGQGRNSHTLAYRLSYRSVRAHPCQ